MDGLPVLENGSESKQHFIDAIEAKDPYTQGHSHHVNVIVKVIFNCLPPVYQQGLDKEMLFIAALLHDIGKVMTPDHVLNKEGALDEEEWQAMRQHPLDGKKIVEKTSFSCIGEWIMYHHERIDGRGYYALPGEKIPLESRIIAIADTFSALRTYRIYRPAKSIGETIHIMRENAGTQLDAEILGHFLSLGTEALEKIECNCEACRLRRLALEAMASAVS